MSARLASSFISLPPPLSPLLLSRPWWSSLSFFSCCRLPFCTYYLYPLPNAYIHLCVHTLEMVGFTTRFALLAALSSFAALTVLPAPVRGGLVNTDAQDFGPSIAARHSAHEARIKAATDDTGGDDIADAKHSRKHHKSSGVNGDPSSDSAGTKHQGPHKTILPLPLQLGSHSNKGPSSPGKGNRKKGERTRTHHPESKEKHAKEAREVYSIDPLTRMRSLWVGGGIAVHDVQLETLPPRLDKRHHHHHHHHHHDHYDHGFDKIVVDGDDDDVHIHRRFLGLIAPAGQVSDPDPDVVVEGTNDHVHVHGHHHDGIHDSVVVKGSNDRIHVHRAAMPHHYHHHHPDTVVVKGDDEHVHVHREPSPHHHHYHPEKVIVNGDHDRVHVHRAPSLHNVRRHHHHHHPDKVIVNGHHDDVHARSRTHLRSNVQRSPHHSHRHPGKVTVKGDHDAVHIHGPAPHRRHHHDHKAVIEGDHQHVHLGRSPVASPEHHHHHHRPDEVIVKGHHDHVDAHRKRFQDYRHPIVIGGSRGKAYLIPHNGLVMNSLVPVVPSAKTHVRRDSLFAGVPGTIEIMSQDSESKAIRIASLVVATPSNGSTAAGSPFVLNASDTDRTQMYMVPAISATNATSANSNSNSSLPSGPPAAPSAGLLVPSAGAAPPSTGSPSTSSASSTSSSMGDPSKISFVEVFLQTPIFNAVSAELEPYCATFDPRPSSPAPMTMEKCSNDVSNDSHKSQVFAYEPDTGHLQPMWYKGEDDGTSDDDSAPSAPSAASAASDPPASPPAAPSPPPGPPVNSSTPVSNGAPTVTSFEQEALDVEFGDSAHSAVRIPEIIAVEALQNAKNVTLLFAPNAPEVLPGSPVGKVAELQVPSVPVAPPAMSPSTGTSTSAAATGSDSTQSASSSSAADSSGAAATTASTTATADASTTDSSAVATEQASVTSSDTGTEDSSSATSAMYLLPAVTPTQALEVKMYDVGASDTADGPSSSVSVSNSTAAAATTLSTNGTESGSSMIPTMTPVSTAPYEWMFKGTNASP